MAADPASPRVQSAPPRLHPSLGQADHLIGPATAPLELVEYGDYQCPHCAAAHATVFELLAHFQDRLRFGFRNFPLSKQHPQAPIAAQAAEAAAAQGMFWDMHHMLFTHQHALQLADLVEYARSLALDDERFRQELETQLHAPRVQQDVASGIRSGVNGTPTFFINGLRHSGGYDLNTLLAALDQAAP